MQRILNISNLTEAVDALCEIEPQFKSIVDRHGLPSLRSSPQGLEGLLMIITEQFLSLQAAASIWSRLKLRLELCEASEILACPESELVSLGLSRTKAKAFHASARSDLDFTALNEIEVSKKLCTIHGVGPWTADIYMLSVLGAADPGPKVIWHCALPFRIF